MRRLFSGCLLAGWGVFLVRAIPVSFAGPAEFDGVAPHWFDDFRNHLVLVENPESSGIQRLEVTGRLQYDFGRFESESARLSVDEFRRSRLGISTEFSDGFRLDLQSDFNLNDPGPAYAGLTYALLQWEPSDDLRFQVGKQFASFTLDGTTSSSRLLTMEINDLSLNVWGPEVFVPGASLRWEPSDFWMHTGVYTGGSASDEFGNFDGTFFVIQKFGYDLTDALGVESASVELDYFYQEPDLDNDFMRPFQHVGSLHGDFDTGRWGFRSDLVVAKGKLGQSDKGGVVLMPYLRLSEKIEWVNRVTWMRTRDLNGIGLGRYENRLAGGRGDEYLELYTGINLYLRGHDLKWQAGLRHIDLTDGANDGGAYDGWGLSTGIRINW